MTKPTNRFLGFALVGAVGFVVDAIILTTLMKGFAIGPYLARAISFAAAVTVTWYLNRRWVFDHQDIPMSRREYGGYVTVQTVGAFINLGVFILMIRWLPQLLDVPVIPLAIGSAVAMLFNFAAAGRWVFATPTNRGVHD